MLLAAPAADVAELVGVAVPLSQRPGTHDVATSLWQATALQALRYVTRWRQHTGWAAAGTGKGVNTAGLDAGGDE